MGSSFSRDFGGFLIIHVWISFEPAHWQLPADRMKDVYDAGTLSNMKLKQVAQRANDS